MISQGSQRETRGHWIKLEAFDFPRCDAKGVLCAVQQHVTNILCNEVPCRHVVLHRTAHVAFELLLDERSECMREGYKRYMGARPVVNSPSSPLCEILWHGRGRACWTVKPTRAQPAAAPLVVRQREIYVE